MSTKKKVTIKNIKNESKKVIRLNESTDKIIKERLARLNNNLSEFGKVNKDKLIHFLVENMTDEQEKLIQTSTLTWDIEEKRLIKIWSKKHGKLNDKKWKELLYTGQLSGFIKEHSRLQVSV